ncbi:MAG: sugar porter family MFS transporter [Pirellulales bacterium]|nr:sugar porter family MFS transporter [Pirellulales bacterium]
MHLGFVWRVCTVAALGGLLFGYDWVVIGGAKPFYEQRFQIAANPLAQGVAMSTALWGCLAGAALSGRLADQIGRKRPLTLAGALFTVSAVATALAGDLTTFNVARFVGGIGIGLASNLSPLYIAEVSPAGMRGRLVSLNQLLLVTGILAAQLVNWRIASDVPATAEGAALAATWCGRIGWRWMFAAEAIPAVGFLALSLLVPESPRWLVKAGRPDDARRVLARIGDDAYAATELSAIQASTAAHAKRPFRLGQLLEPSLRRPLQVGVGLAVLQQWCGINVIFNYAEEVFRAAGYQVRDIMFVIVVTGLVNLLFTLVGMAAVDRFGRRKLMLSGAGGLTVLFGLLGAFYFVGSQGPHMVALVLASIACYAMSLAPVTWVVISEIFPTRVRGTAMSAAVFALWLACSLLTFTFPWLNSRLGAAGTFWLYAAICAVGLAFMALRLPETRHRSLEEIERDFASQ